MSAETTHVTSFSRGGIFTGEELRNLRSVGACEPPSHHPIMKASTRSIATGNANVVKGDAKQLAGKALGKKLLQARGRAQKMMGRLQQKDGKQQRRDGN